MVNTALRQRGVWSSTQRHQFDRVRWDDMLSQKPCVFPYAYERNADAIASASKVPADPQPSHDYQGFGNVWDKMQSRRGEYGPRPMSFVSVMPRAGQLVGYAGEIGTREEPGDKDNKYVPYTPMTLKRNEIPQPSFTTA